jgi:beta-lactamase regulating signal transducer with metallopeptidase domain
MMMCLAALDPQRPVMFLDRLASVAGDALFEASWQAAILALIVAIICLALGNRISSAWRCALWLVVFARLLLPWTPQSSVSIFNIARPWWTEARATRTSMQPATVFGWVSRDQLLGTPTVEASLSTTSNRMSAVVTAPVASPIPAQSSQAASTSIRPTILWSLLLLWMIGALAVLILLFIGHMRLRRILKGSRLLGNAHITGVVEHCRTLIGVDYPVTLTENASVQTPLLIGVIRPVLVLSEGLAARLAEEELRDVILHELAHVKRRDILVSWFMSLVLVVHWFNPVAWIAAARWRAERELACDELVLRILNASRRPHYGRTLLKLVEHASCPTSFPAVAGIVENNADLKRRISMIARFRPRSLGSTLIAGVTLTLDLAAGLTNAQTRAAKLIPAAAPSRIGIDQPVKPESPFRQGASDIHFYTQAYRDEESKDSIGRAMWTLPKETTLEVLPEYRGSGANGKEYLDKRITIVAQDRANQFWGMIASLETEDVRLLKAELEKAIPARKAELERIGNTTGDDKETTPPRFATWEKPAEFGEITMPTPARLAVANRALNQPILISLISAPAGAALRTDMEFELRVSRAARLLTALSGELARRDLTKAAEASAQPTTSGPMLGREKITDHFLFTRSGIKSNEYGVLQLAPRSTLIVDVNEPVNRAVDPRVTLTLKDASGSVALISRIPAVDAAALAKNLQDLVTTKKADAAPTATGENEIVVAPQKYTPDASGMVHLALVPFKVMPQYNGIKLNGERITDPRITLIIEDRENGFWPLVARLDLKVAEKLAIDLAAASVNAHQ